MILLVQGKGPHQRSSTDHAGKFFEEVQRLLKASKQKNKKKVMRPVIYSYATEACPV